MSIALQDLNVSHSIRWTNKLRFVSCGFPQPKLVHITNDIHRLKSGAINFVVASFGELALTNFPLMVDVKSALLNPVETDVVVSRPSVMDYVNTITKPSLLGDIQTLVHKIQPYSLRKETQAMVIAYFAGTVSKSALEKALKRSYKTIALVELIKKSSALKNAVQLLKTNSAEEVEALTDVPAFELRYISKVRT